MDSPKPEKAEESPGPPEWERFEYLAKRLFAVPASEIKEKQEEYTIKKPKCVSQKLETE